MSWISARSTRREGLLRGAGALALGLALGAQGSLGAEAAQEERGQADQRGEVGREAEAARRRRRRRRRPVPQLCQRIIVPAYFDPGPSWERAIAGAPSTGLMILNPNSGPDEYQEQWLDVTRAAQAAGITVLGYVLTNLGRRDPAVVRAEIDQYFDWYGVDGIYLDVATGQGAQIPYYRNLADHVRAWSSDATVALNPALDLDERYLDFVDILEIYEWTYEDYGTKLLPAWIHDYPADRFIHVVYGVPNRRAAQETLNLAKRRNAGYVFLTQIRDPALIYKSLGGYWDLQVGRVCP